MVIKMNNNELAAKKFTKLLLEGKIRKNILPNTACDYTMTAELRDLKKYIRFINSSAYDDIMNCEVRKYNADE